MFLYKKRLSVCRFRAMISEQDAEDVLFRRYAGIPSKSNKFILAGYKNLKGVFWFMGRPIILDTDPGIDDAVAFVVLLSLIHI